MSTKKLSARQIVESQIKYGDMAEVAKQLNVSWTTVYQHIKGNRTQMPAAQKYLIKAAEVIFERRQKEAAAAEILANQIQQIIGQ